MIAETSTKFPYVEWADFPEQMDWEQGEHVTIIAPTGDGKTLLMTELVNEREYVVYLQAKARDETLNRLEGFRKMDYPQSWAKRVLVKPPFYKKDPDRTKKTQRQVFRKALLGAFSQEGWAVFVDEIRWFTNDLDLKDELIMMELHGRSLDVSVVASTQRPRHIPLEFYDQPTHLFLFADSDRENLRRLTDIGGHINKQALMTAIPELERHHFLYVNTRTNEVVESKVEL